jgi:cobalt-precorrin-5B (C1)-methyltransferase
VSATGRDRSKLRTGFTTGACAAAAAKAAAIALLRGTLPESAEITLPAGTRVRFPVLSDPSAPPERGRRATAVVLKDAGDDPDCTDGARITVTAEVLPGATESEIRAGRGVGTVTKPGLGLPVGAPAVNPVPRRMILASIAEVTDMPLLVTIAVPGGEQMAKKTTNERLGILGGISILGTTGIVKPFSTAAYRASVVQQVDVAAAQGERTMVLCTGSRSEKAARRLYPGLDPVCLVEVGDFTGIAVRRCASAGMETAALVAMAGKIAKLAAGVMMTHFHRSKVDTSLLERLALDTAAPAEVVRAATETDTARHFFEACVAAGHLEPLVLLARLARMNLEAHTGDRIACPVAMVDYEGREVIARA